MIVGGFLAVGGLLGTVILKCMMPSPPLPPSDALAIPRDTFGADADELGKPMQILVRGQARWETEFSVTPWVDSKNGIADVEGSSCYAYLLQGQATRELRDLVGRAYETDIPAADARRVDATTSFRTTLDFTEPLSDGQRFRPGVQSLPILVGLLHWKYRYFRIAVFYLVDSEAQKAAVRKAHEFAHSTAQQLLEDHRKHHPIATRLAFALEGVEATGLLLFLLGWTPIWLGPRRR